MGAQFEHGRVVGAYVEKYNNRESRWIARLIQREHPNMFPNLERIRGVIRYYRGRCGRLNRAKIDRKGVYNHIKLPPITPDNPHQMPIADHINRQPYIVGANFRRILVLADLHIPYHDMRALGAAIKEGKRYNPDMVLLDGDILDCYQESFFCKDPDTRNLAGEILKGKEFLAALRQMFPKAHIVYKEGNHEWRHKQYLRSNAPAVANIEGTQFETLLDLYNLGVDWVGGKRAIHCGHLTVLHGHEFSRGNVPINAARYTFTKTKDNALVGHWHHTSEHTETRVRRDEIITCWSCGCLCQLQPEYMPINGWGHGFVMIERFGTGGDFHLHNKKIYNGAVL